jgi:cytochrome c-type biogenesis protein CcmH
LIAKALALDPDDPQTLWLAGTAAFNRSDYAAAVKHWEHALRQVPPDSEGAQSLATIIAEAREKGDLGKTGAGKPTKAAAAGASIMGRIDLAPAMKGQAAPTDTVFVLAKAAGGSPMPLAAKRMRVADLPTEFVLDDGDAVMPSQKISSATTLVVQARVAKSGDAKPQPGDLIGSISGVKPGARNLHITIDRVIE